MPKTVRFHNLGGPEVLSLDEVDVPLPGKGEVRIRTRALGLNRAEIMFRTGNYVVEPVFPQALGYEAAGTVEAVGAEVSGLTVGDAVSVVPAFAMTEYALHGELVLAPAHAVVKHPEQLTWEEAAGVWMPFITAYGGLIDLAGLSAGDTVVIPAASSSVGLAAIQIANMIGAKPVALTRTSSKRQQLIDAGAAAVIATEEEHVVERLDQITDGAGVQVIFDPVAGPLLPRLIDAASTAATVVIYGALSTDDTALPVLAVLGKHITIRGYELFEVTTDPERLRGAVAFVRDGLNSGALKPTVDKVFEMENIAEAYQYLESNGQIGKVVVSVPQNR
ncbi:zinc-dependent alcohol dehydrogenase family protein [Arthrobacter sp. Sa2CUA1]|uniref:Zinc-dependent alcohol dehydrogenase family protein n=1 Tax=Arthrobacter gallicola TaxID=2762225 RepID=A0ABR8USA8_9MICC|nr:zinc-dependent alcohol dehydrogenase family protein [Arthrobacter gallicola]MBD7995437.1 zinc-dependent alcohol dehydrogenase family protein [Arthrobacter gallicola]